MDLVRQALQQMGASMSVVVQQIYNVMDLCNDGQLRKLSEQGSRNSRESAAEAKIISTQPNARRSVCDIWAESKVHYHCLSSVSLQSAGAAVDVELGTRTVGFWSRVHSC